MKKTKEHANELVVSYSDAVMNNNWDIFKTKISDVFYEVAVNEVKELQKARNIKLDTGLIPIFKDQRAKYGSICRIVNTVKADLLSITDFDEVIKEICNDEAYTPEYGVKPILKYIPSNFIVWCPFDKADSAFVQMISKTNKVIHSHIDTGQNFFDYEPTEDWDCIVSNPPFKGKRQFFERALSFNKPFALLMTNAWLNDAYSKKVFMEANKQMQLLMFDKRIKFDNPYGKPNNKITFSSSYYCSDFLPNDLICEELSEHCI